MKHRSALSKQWALYSRPRVSSSSSALSAFLLLTHMSSQSGTLSPRRSKSIILVWIFGLIRFCFSVFFFFLGRRNFLCHVWNVCLTSENGKKKKRCLCCVGRRLWQERICCGCSELRLSTMERFVVAILRWSRWCPPGKFDTYSAIETSWRRFEKMALRHLVEQVCVYLWRTFVVGTLWYSSQLE